MKREVKIGLTVVVAALVVYFTIAWAKSIHFFSASRDTYFIEFDNVNGLMEGDPVTVHGYPQGNVVSFKPGPSNILVEISLDYHMELFADAQAQILVKELMGGKLVEIKPGGGAGAPKLQSGATLQGQTSMDISTSFAKMGRFMENFDPEVMDSLFLNMSRLASSFADLGEEMQKEDMGNLFAELNGSAERLNRILGDVENRKIVPKLDETMGKIGELSDKGNEALTSIETLTDRMNEKTVPELEHLLAETESMLNKTEEVMVDVQDILSAMKNKNTVAGKFVYDEAFAKDLEYTVDNLNKTLDHLRTKKVYVSLWLSKKQKKMLNEEE